MRIRNWILGSMVTAAIAIPAAVQARTVEYEITVAPPAPRVEVVPAPREGFIDGRQYVWVDGQFIARREGHTYTPHFFERRGEHWVFRGGHWDDD
jgi:hypothetical protein